MALLTRVPPGRAGRMWLRSRLGTAQRGRDQLDRRLRILLPEQQRLRIEADRRREAWESACAEGDTWLLRAAMLGGEDAIRHATPTRRADVEVSWSVAMGLRFPSDAHLLGPRPEPPPVAGNAAVGPAAEAYGAALLAGVRLATVQEALRRLDTEIAITRRRLRALESRWLPALRDALAVLEQSLEQAEQEDTMRLHRSAGARPDGRSSP